MLSKHRPLRGKRLFNRYISFGACLSFVRCALHSYMPTGARPVGDLTSQLSRTYVTPLPGPTRYRTALMSGELQEDEGPMSALELSDKTNENTADS